MKLGAGPWLALAVLLAGCAERNAPAPVDLQPSSTFEMEFAVRGNLPVLAPSLPLTHTSGGTLLLRFEPGDKRLDSFVRVHDTTLMTVVHMESGVETGRVYIDARTLGIVQILLRASELPPEFAEQVILRPGNESSCLHGAAFFGHPLEVEGVGSVGGDGALISFKKKGFGSHLGHDVAVHEAKTSAGTLEVWASPFFPCPLRGKLTSPLGQSIYEFEATSLGATMLELRGTGEPRAIAEVETASQGAYGQPSDGPEGARFGLQRAILEAEKDAAFARWLGSHPNSKLLTAKFEDFRWGPRQIEVWQLIFAGRGQAGYEVQLERQTPLGLRDAATHRVTLSEEKAISSGERGHASDFDEKVPTLKHYYTVLSKLFPSELAHRLTWSNEHSVPTLQLDYARESTRECELTMCTGSDLLATLTFNSKNGELLGYSGGFDAWRAAHDEAATP